MIEDQPIKVNQDALQMTHSIRTQHRNHTMACDSSLPREPDGKFYFCCRRPGMERDDGIRQFEVEYTIIVVRLEEPQPLRPSISTISTAQQIDVSSMNSVRSDG